VWVRFHPSEVLFGTDRCRQCDDILSGDHHLTYRLFTDIEGVHHLLPAVGSHVAIFKHRSKPVSEVGTTLNNFLLGLGPRLGHLDAKQPECCFCNRVTDPDGRGENFGEPVQWSETEQFFRAGIVAIDITEADPFTGDRTGYEDEIIGTKEKTDEYAYQWATVQLVGNAVPIVLDARPVRKGESRLEIVEDLLDSAEELVHVDNVLMDREFDSQHVLEMLSQRGLSYVVPKRMQTSEKAQAKRLLKRGKNRYETDRKLHLGKNEWHETTLIYRRKEDSEHDDHRQYSVFMSNRGGSFLTEYGYRWEIESGYRSIKRFMAGRRLRISDCDSSTSRSRASYTQSGERSIYSCKSSRLENTNGHRC
jgi:hypothetical protein